MFQLRREFLYRGFFDHLRINVKAGNGGSGLPKYGGKGGRGGHVFIQASDKLTLKLVESRIKEKKLHAQPGTNSHAHGLIGTAGEDLIIKVPTGVVAYDDNGIRIGKNNYQLIYLFICNSLIINLFLFLNCARISPLDFNKSYRLILKNKLFKNDSMK